MEKLAEPPSILQQLAALAALPQESAAAMPPTMYHSSAIAALEQSNIFQKEWLCAGPSQQIPKPADYLSFDIADQSVVIIRQKNGEIKAFANVCRHRMMTLLSGSGSCKNKRIMCPYHAWS